MFFWVDFRSGPSRLVDAEELSKRELTIDDVLEAIRSQHQETPGGRVESRDKEYNIRVMGEAVSVQDFGKFLSRTVAEDPYSTLPPK